MCTHKIFSNNITDVYWFLQGYDFEQTVLFLVKALVELKEGDAIMGVYNWCKEQTGKKFLWIKALVEKATGK